jgi:tetratricopeptide (TPR) repeat protein
MILPMLRLLSLLPLLLGVAACGPAGRGGAASPSEALKGLPAPRDPALALDDDDDLRRARQLWEALPLDDGARPGRRRELVEAYRARIDAALARDDRADAFERFQEAIGLWDAAELQDERKAPQDLAMLAPVAKKLYELFAPTGQDIEAVTGLVVLMAAEPQRAAEYQAIFADIAAYSDELAVSIDGPGAARKRPIEMLEKVTAQFPLPWAGLTLARLYLERHDAFVTAIQKRESTESLASHGESLLIPAWNLVRVYVRIGRLDAAVAELAKLDGKVGEDPELREALEKALAPEATGQAWTRLLERLAGAGRGAEDEEMFRRIAVEGARRLPRAHEPVFLAGYFAFRQERIPLAIRWLEADLPLAPKGKEADTYQLLGIAYLQRMNDYLVSERVDAARAQLTALETFHQTALTKVGKPLEPSLRKAFVTMGRGLYSQGRIDDALVELRRAQAPATGAEVDDKATRAEATEWLGHIALKRGQPLQAAKLYQEAVAFERETPLEKLVDTARLRRLAGEAYLVAGDRRQAAPLFQNALDEWEQVLRAQITPGQRADALLERGRLLQLVGEREAAVSSMLEAVEVASLVGMQGTYGDVIAFLVVRGAYDAAVDVYLRAIAERGATEYLKIYPSLWIVMAARVNGALPPPMAAEYLASRRGTRWYHDLARYASGELAFGDLEKRADTRGKRAEAYFYEGLRRYGEGDAKGGEHFMQLVVQTEMFGFYEFDMASWVLRHGFK